MESTSNINLLNRIGTLKIQCFRDGNYIKTCEKNSVSWF